jgi:hypothetical protein
MNCLSRSRAHTCRCSIPCAICGAPLPTRYASRRHKVTTSPASSTRTRTSRRWSCTGAIILTSIHRFVDQQTLAQRPLPLTLRALECAARREEGALWREFNAARPAIYRGVLDLVAKILAHLRTSRCRRRSAWRVSAAGWPRWRRPTACRAVVPEGVSRDSQQRDAREPARARQSANTFSRLAAIRNGTQSCHGACDPDHARSALARYTGLDKGGE